MKPITKDTLNFVFSVAKYLYFEIDIDTTVQISSLSKQSTRDKFLAALDFIIDQDVTLLGGFQIRYVDQTRQAIKKIPSLNVKIPRGFQEQNAVLPLEYVPIKDGKFVVLNKPYKHLFEHGDTEKTPS